MTGHAVNGGAWAQEQAPLSPAQKLLWMEVSSAPRDGSAFLMGTASGGIMAELWHYCAETEDFAGLHSGVTLNHLRRHDPREIFMWTRVSPPVAA